MPDLQRDSDPGGRPKRNPAQGRSLVPNIREREEVEQRPIFAHESSNYESRFSCPA